MLGNNGKIIYFVKLCAIIDMVFLFFYSCINYITTLRLEKFNMYIEMEKAIPFISWFIIFYLSMFILFFFPYFYFDKTELKILFKKAMLAMLLAFTTFLIFPAQLGYERVIPNDIFNSVYMFIFAFDHPHNLFPSLHIMFSSLIIFAIFKKTRYKLLYGFWLLLISLSVLFTHQHHVFDIILGFIYIFLINLIIKGETNEVKF